MNIEFYTPEGQVREWIINYVKEQLMKLYKRNKKIARAEVYFRDQGNQKVCEVDLSMYGESMLVHNMADSFDKAAREVLQELTRKIEEQLKTKNEPPDEITSTIKV